MTGALKIAFTYDSKDDVLALGFTAEQASAFASQLFINGVEGGLRSLGHKGKDWDLVFNVCEGVFGKAKEVQVPALLDAYEIPYTFSDAACLALASDKAETKMILQHYGIPTSAFLLISAHENSEAATSDLSPAPYWMAVLKDQLSNSNLGVSVVEPLFIKSTLESASNGTDHLSRATSLEDLIHALTTLQGRFPKQDLMIERFANGRELTISIIGSAHEAKILGILKYRRRLRAQGTATLATADDVDFQIFEIKNDAHAFLETVNVTHEDSDEVMEAGKIAWLS